MAWAVDFARAVRGRPRWARVLFRFALGRYAYREFVGLQDELSRQGWSPYFDYDLRRLDYHHDKVPFDWAKERAVEDLK